MALFDERGAEYAGTIKSFEVRHAVVEIAAATRSRAEVTAGLILAAAVIKGPRMDFLVEKAAELGAAELWPVLCTRGVVREVGGERLARWRRLATAAAKQSLARASDRGHRSADARRLDPAAQRGQALRGPERGCAGFGRDPARSPAALAVATLRTGGRFHGRGTGGQCGAAGYVAAGLGGRRLRSETAALAALSIAAGALDEFGGED